MNPDEKEQFIVFDCWNNSIKDHVRHLGVKEGRAVDWLRLLEAL